MAFLIRKINYNKWLACKDLAKEKYHADAITVCTKTSGNTLSVWRAEAEGLESEANKPIITAIATIMNKLDLLDLVLLNEEDFIKNGISLVENDGDSKIEQLNNQHRDLAEIDYEKLGFVAEKIVEALSLEGRYLRVPKADVATLLHAHYGEGLADSPLEPKLKEEVTKNVTRRAAR